MTTRHGVIASYGKRLPINENTPRISLGEGNTPCIESQHIGAELGLASLYFKFEGLNPTGSFKDRGMVIAVAKALEAGMHTIVCASTGNTSASASAYGARYGLRTAVVIPQGKIAAGKLAQAQVHGAEVLEIEGNFDDALRAVRELTEQHAVTLVNSVNPFRLEGQKTAAFEIVDELGTAPDVLAIPVGNAANITAYWKGFSEYAGEGRCGLPRMIGGQAAGAAPIVLGQSVKDPTTIATAIRIGKPTSWQPAVAACHDSKGVIDSVTDEEILESQRELARVEGIFCEPASAASLAVLRKLIASGDVMRGSRAVCVLTGNGLKDVAAATLSVAQPTLVAADANSIAVALQLI